MHANGEYKRDGRATFVGGYIRAEDKRRLQMLARIRRKTVSSMLAELVQEATAPLAEMNAEQIRA